MSPSFQKKQIYYTDAELLQALRSSKRVAREKAEDAAYCTHWNEIQSFLQKEGATAYEAEDIYQDAFLAFCKKAKDESFVLTAPVKTCLTAICKNQWLKKLKKRKNMVAQQKEIPLEFDKETNDIIQQFESETYNPDIDEMIEFATKEVDKLGVKCREIVTMFYYHKKNMKEITQELNYTNDKTAKTQKNKCMEQLRQKTRALPRR